MMLFQFFVTLAVSIGITMLFILVMGKIKK